MRSYSVHVYTAIRVKVSVTAQDHHSAMKAADRLLFDEGLPIALVTRSAHVEMAEHAEEVLGYLVDEVSEEHYRRTRSYGPDHQPDTSRA